MFMCRLCIRPVGEKAFCKEQGQRGYEQQSRELFLLIVRPREAGGEAGFLWLCRARQLSLELSRCVARQIRFRGWQINRDAL